MSLVVFFAKSKIRLNAPLDRILALLQLSCANKHIIATQCRSSASLNGFSNARAVNNRHAIVTASVSLVLNSSLPFDLDKFDIIFNDSERNGLLSFAKQIIQLMLSLLL